MAVALPLRGLGLADVLVAAGALAGLPQAERAAALDRMLCQAQMAEAYRRKTGQPHPQFGNGTLEAAARRFPIAQIDFLNPEYCRAAALILTRLAKRASVQG